MYDYKQISTCYRCGESDHIAKNCKSDKEVCPICCENHSMRDHKKRQLTKVYCKKCDSHNHPLLTCKRKQDKEPMESMNLNKEVDMDTTTLTENKGNKDAINEEITVSSEKPNNKAHGSVKIVNKTTENAVSADNDKEVQDGNSSLNKDQTLSLGSLQKQIDQILAILRNWEPKTSS
ncbi:MAG: hypothetical protein GY694_09090 [Gammaproteobacteria bacterium]|nr:hypothetical protein [Gammaproteobacteria bacterium]